MIVVERTAAEMKKTKPTTKRKPPKAAKQKTPTKPAMQEKSVKPRNKATTPAAPDAEAPRIECRLLVGDLSVLVDASSLSHTLGCADCAGKGLVDQWPDAVWTGLLVHLGLPADPLDRETAAAPVKRLVQRLWYQAVKGSVPDEPMFSKRDAAKTVEYKETFTTVKETATAKSDRARTNFAKTRVSSDAALDAKITILVKKNPYRAGTRAAASYEAIKQSKTVGEFKTACMVKDSKTGLAPKFTYLAWSATAHNSVPALIKID